MAPRVLDADPLTLQQNLGAVTQMDVVRRHDCAAATPGRDGGAHRPARFWLRRRGARAYPFGSRVARRAQRRGHRPESTSGRPLSAVRARVLAAHDGSGDCVGARCAEFHRVRRSGTRRRQPAVTTIRDSRPLHGLSPPLGAARMTRDFIRHDPPHAHELSRLSEAASSPTNAAFARHDLDAGPDGLDPQPR